MKRIDPKTEREAANFLAGLLVGATFVGFLWMIGGAL